jgi:hypothetical protein
MAVLSGSSAEVRELERAAAERRRVDEAEMAALYRPTSEGRHTRARLGAAVRDLAP